MPRSTNNSKIRYKYDKRNRKSWKPIQLQRYGNPQKTLKKMNRFSSKKGECAGFMKSAQYADVITTFVPIDFMLNSFRDRMEEWIEYVNDLGFPCSYMGESPVTYSSSKTYAVNIYPRNYPPKGRHLLAVHSLIRYAYSYRYRDISYHTLNLHDKYGMNKWKCLYLAHYSMLDRSSYKSYYGLLPDSHIKQSKKKFIYPPDHVGVLQWLCKKSIVKSFTNEIEKDLPKFDGEYEPLCEDNYDDYIEHLNLM